MSSKKLLSLVICAAQFTLLFAQDAPQSDVLPNVKRDLHPTAVCPTQLLKSRSIKIEDISGQYKKSVNGLLASSNSSSEKREGYNYLAISQSKDGSVLIRLKTKEVNGHDCGVETAALLCGSYLVFSPNQDDLDALESKQLPIPILKINKNSIAFAQTAGGGYVWGSPYCGTRGYLNQAFSRSTLQKRIDPSIFAK